MKTNYLTPKFLSSTGRGLSWVCAVLLAVAPCGRAATDAVNAAALRSNLPANVTLKQSSIPQMVKALHEAVVQHHDDALDLLRIAVLAKTPKQGDGLLSCDDLRRLTEAACTAAPDQTSQLIDMASSLRPECADGLQDLLGAGDALGVAGTFGVGFGAGFPGAPGFVGSAPSSGIAFPPVVPAPVTSVVNN